MDFNGFGMLVKILEKEELLFFLGDLEFKISDLFFIDS